ncbi:non-ribosomal peptide synthetase [Vibrio tarriae]|uniref:non-ribosomal peptide synthetase n=1 Tax=Vibrio tarriae TaxID=2014742 RepID=UPI000DE253D9|nr:non-ribosomal peptide synthetase [Vibrio tarriae]RBM43981.1 hypothetical protein DLR63_00040 [Vibrio tarriae]
MNGITKEGNETLTLAELEVYEAHENYPESARYNLGSYEVIDGVLDLDRLEDCVRTICHQEEVFHYSYCIIEGIPSKLPHLDSHAFIKRYDFSLWEYKASHEEVHKTIQRYIQQPFCLISPPLYIFLIFKCAENQHVLAHIWHHIVMDGVGFNQYHQRIVNAYNDFQGDLEHTDDLCPLTLRDISSSEQDYWESNRREKDEQYWTEFAKTSYQIISPIKSEVDGVAVKRHYTPLSVECWSKLQKFPCGGDVTLQHYMLLALQLCFADSRGRPSLMIGRPTHRRTSKAMKSKVAHFAGLSLLQLDLPPSMTICEAMHDLKARLRSDIRHQRYPVTKLSRENKIARNQNQQICDLLFSYESMPFHCHYGEAFGRLKALANLDDPTPVQVYVREYTVGEVPDIDIQLNRQYFSQDELHSLPTRLFYILNQLIFATNNMPLGEINLLTPDESMCYAHLQTIKQPPFEPCSLLDSINLHTERSPLSLAVKDEDGRAISYRDLQQDIDRVAFELVHLGVSANQQVVLYLPRSYQVMVLMLAVNRLGATYIPISPDQPTQRTQTILQQLDVQVLIGHERFPQVVTDVKYVSVDTLFAYVHSADSTDGMSLDIETPQDYRAYILFTSGSTGRPKGVMIGAKARDHFLHQICQRLKMTQRSYVPAITSIGFDISVLELFAPLMSGGTVHILSESTQRSARRLAVMLNLLPCTHIQATPTTWNMLLESGQMHELNAYAILGGEPVPGELIKKLNRLGLKCWNAYGPTESTVWVMLEPIKALSATTPIGGLLEGCFASVRDPHMRILPPGTIGELVLSGCTLAEGYLGLEEKTAEVFVIDKAGQRYYRTGDLVALRPDGLLDFLGRSDSQCKIRGHRIELGDIENAVLSHPDVTRCCVVVIDTPMGKDLVCCYQGDVDYLPIQTELKLSLPAYMVPSKGVKMLEWPINANAKTDRNVLSALCQSQQLLEMAPPQRKVNERSPYYIVSNAWWKILRSRVDNQTNFFDAGGTSLIANKLLYQLEKELDQKLSDTFVFEYPTQAAMVAFLSSTEHLTTGKLSDEYHGGPSLQMTIKQSSSSFHTTGNVEKRTMTRRLLNRQEAKQRKESDHDSAK